MSILNITNGDCARRVMERAGIAGDIICWHDVLHEGPVPSVQSLAELSTIRASFIARQSWGDIDRVRASFERRDADFIDLGKYQQVLLWFEHDLYDQLQLLQILDCLATMDRGRTQIAMVCVDEYLGATSASRLKVLEQLRTPVSPSQLQLGLEAWRAFRSSDPTQWQALLQTDTSPLPYLRDAVERHLEQYPDANTGLNRTEQQILEAVSAGHSRPYAVFDYNQRADGIRFMGDSVFWSYVRHLCSGDVSPLRISSGADFLRPTDCVDVPAFKQQKLILTDIGKDLLLGKQDWLSVKPINRWYGGVRLCGANNWRWNSQDKTLAKM